MPRDQLQRLLLLRLHFSFIKLNLLYSEGLLEGTFAVELVSVLERKCNLLDARSHRLKEERDDLLSFFLEKNLEVFESHIARGVAPDANREDVLFDLRHRRLSH